MIAAAPGSERRARGGASGCRGSRLQTDCTAGLVAGVPLRDIQYAMRHSHSRTTLRYGVSRANLDRHVGAAHRRGQQGGR